jgi:hypothetical protein
MRSKVLYVGRSWTCWRRSPFTGTSGSALDELELDARRFADPPRGIQDFDGDEVAPRVEVQNGARLAVVARGNGNVFLEDDRQRIGLLVVTHPSSLTLRVSGDLIRAVGRRYLAGHWLLVDNDSEKIHLSGRLPLE